MDFLLNHLTISFINKEKMKDAELIPPDNVFNDEISQKFAKEVISSYFQRHSIERSYFDRIAEGIKPGFEQLLNKYLDSERKSKDFLEFSKNALFLLKKEMDDKRLSTGGYVVIADIKMKYNFVFVAIINEKIKFRVESLKIAPTEVLDTEKLAMAGFVNIDLYKESNNENIHHYISFLKGLREVAKYFISFLGASEGLVSLKKQTNELIKAIKDFLKKEKSNLSEEELLELKHRIFENLYNKAKNKEKVSLDFISELIDSENPKLFRDFVQNPQSNYNIDTIFDRLDKEALKRLTYFKYRGKGFSLSFDKEKYFDKIKIKDNENEVELIINNPPKELVNSLKEEGF